MAASENVLLILRWVRDGKDVFGLSASNSAWLIAVNRAKKAVDFTVDCGAAGHGMYHGRIEAETARYIEL